LHKDLHGFLLASGKKNLYKDLSKLHKKTKNLTRKAHKHKGTKIRKKEHPLQPFRLTSASDRKK
jgi:hypothetical protein